MTLKELEKNLKKKAEDVKLIIDSPTLFRIFIYTQRTKYPITAFIDRQKQYRIIKISDYPKQEGHYPICVVRVERLRIIKKRKKARKTVTDTPSSAIISKDNKIVNVNKNGK